MEKKIKPSHKSPQKSAHGSHQKHAREGSVNPATSPSGSKQYKKTSEYGRQLAEKQRVKKMYGLREKQFKILFKKALHQTGATGKVLLALLESRLDNIVYRLKFCATRRQARQVVVHGHITVNGKKVFSPSMLLEADDIIQLSSKSKENTRFLEEIINQSLAAGTKVPDWLELDKTNYLGRVLRAPVREDIQASINESFIVELYSKN